MSIFKQYPATIIVTILALVSAISPGCTAWFEMDTNLVAQGQWWRIITGHWTHFGWSHLFWDLLMFVVLSAACERKLSRWHGPFLLLSFATITAAIGLACPEITTYRGLSGIDTGLFMLWSCLAIRSSADQGDRLNVGLLCFPLVGLIAKLCFEVVTGGTLFVDSDSFTPLVESHLAGLACGLIGFVWQLGIFQKDWSSQPALGTS